MNTNHENRGNSVQTSSPYSTGPANVLRALQGAMANVSNRPLSRWMKAVAGLGGAALVVVLVTMAAMPAGVRRTPVREVAGMAARASLKSVMPSGPASVASTAAPEEESMKRMMNSSLAGRSADERKGPSAGATSDGLSSPLPAVNISLPTLMDRAVIRKATIEIKAAEVQVVFAKVSTLLSEASGEYIEQSSFSGEGPTAQATLKLRVAASRLSTVLTGVRGLGNVTSESSGGEDVTDQAVDLEARIANERRVEKEMVGLLDSRTNAPLAEVLSLREHISRVRESIERMEVAQSKLSRLVALATVLVVIRADAAGPELAEVAPSLGARFSKGVSEAWTSAMVQLSESAAWLVFVLIAGLPWWIGGLAALMAGRVIFRRLMASPVPASAPSGETKVA